MDVAIIGVPLSGKTTVFNALTRGNADTTGPSEMHVGVVKVADPRVYVLAGMFHPRKIIHAEVKYWDLPGPESLANSQGLSGKYLNVLQAADAFLLVVRTFTDRHGLKDLCREVLGISISKEQQSSDWGAKELSASQIEYAAADVLHLHRLRERLDEMLVREGRDDLAKACFAFVPHRAALDLAGWADSDIFAH